MKNLKHGTPLQIYTHPTSEGDEEEDSSGRSWWKKKTALEPKEGRGRKKTYPHDKNLGVPDRKVLGNEKPKHLSFPRQRDAFLTSEEEKVVRGEGKRGKNKKKISLKKVI